MRRKKEDVVYYLDHYIKKGNVIVIKSTDFVKNNKLVQTIPSDDEEKRAWLDENVKQAKRKISASGNKLLFAYLYIDFNKFDKSMPSLQAACNALLFQATGAIRDLLAVYNEIRKDETKRKGEK